MNDEQMQTAKQWITVVSIIVAVAAIVWYLSRRGLSSEDLVVLVGLQIAAVVIPQVVEQKILGKAA